MRCSSSFGGFGMPKVKFSSSVLGFDCNREVFLEFWEVEGQQWVFSREFGRLESQKLCFLIVFGCWRATREAFLDYLGV